MFDKIHKNAQKAAKKIKKEAEARQREKTPEQIAFEKMRDEGGVKAEKFLKEAFAQLNDMGYTCRPIIQHINADQPAIVRAQMVMNQLSYENYQHIQKEKADRLASAEGKQPEGSTEPVAAAEGKAEESAT